ncbi:sigma 54-interacting transcriptional regulator [bacterium]|nr:sigma 54-interacting transcriptional regulator [bacterium]MCI0602333.1 sigma 54-interacting transcriptional regulator [bacterium]
MREGISSTEVFRLLSVLNSRLRIQDLLPKVLDTSLELTGAERAFLMLYDRSNQLSIKAARDHKQKDLPEEDFSGSTSIIEKVLTERKPLCLPRVRDHKEFAAAGSVRKFNLHSTICLPLFYSDPDKENTSKLLGVLYIDSSKEVAALTSQDLQLMEMLASHIAITLSNARLFEEIEALNAKLQNRVEVQASSLNEMKMLLAETQREVAKVYGLGMIIGKSKPMLKLFKALEKVVQTEATVLIQGESGTGKEMVAKYIHYNGPREEKPLISINCSAFNDSLLESELFGYVKGAFTGADKNKIGLFQIADGGTLFLDEVGDMSPDMQKKLLRVLQEGEVRPIGSGTAYRVNVRIVAATNKRLKDLMQSGLFREDLYFRLAVITLEVPPLRERREDIPLLIDYFRNKISDELKRPLPVPSDSVFRKLMTHDWPGNIRELENELRSIFILEDQYEWKDPAEQTEDSEEMNLLELEKRTVLRALESANGNKSKAADLLGITRRTFYKKLIKHHIY